MIKLLIMSKAGDNDAKEKILEKFLPLISKVGISYYILGYEQEDLMQLTRLIIINSIENFDINRGVPFEAYINRAVKNGLGREIQKASKRYYDISLNKQITDSIEFGDIFKDNTDIEKEYQEKELRDNLYKVIEGLSKKEKTLLKKLYVEKMSVSDYVKEEKLTYHKVIYFRDKLLREIARLLGE